MNKCWMFLSILASIALFITACSALAVQAKPQEQASVEAVAYEDVLGKSLDDRSVASFIGYYDCEHSGPFRLCPSIGVVLWANSDQTIQTAYLYISNSKDFASYKGKLPFGLASSDTMANVEQKLG